MALAKAGDDQAFAELIEPYARELQVHCYRIPGSAHGAEDALQEALLSAWRGLAGFQERASLRSWLYRITTNRRLQTLRAQPRGHVRSPRPWTSSRRSRPGTARCRGSR